MDANIFSHFYYYQTHGYHSFDTDGMLNAKYWKEHWKLGCSQHGCSQALWELALPLEISPICPHMHLGNHESICKQNQSVI